MRANLCEKYGDVFICLSKDVVYSPLAPLSYNAANKELTSNVCEHFVPLVSGYAGCKYLLHGIKCNSKRAKEDASIISKMEEL